MIFQTLIRSPDTGLNQALLLGLRLSEDDCVAYCVELMNDKVPPRIISLGFKAFPSGFVIEGVAYGPEDDDVIDAYDFDLRVLH
jgi:hypothetical protein